MSRTPLVEQILPISSDLLQILTQLPKLLLRDRGPLKTLWVVVWVVWEGLKVL